MRKEWKKYVTLLSVVALITGCSSSTETQISTTGTSTEITTSGSEIVTSNDIQLINLSTSSEIVIDTEFTARDLEVGYEETAATKITLSQNEIEINGAGATEEDNIITISDEGVYVFSGTLVDGQIKIEAEDTDKIQLVLNEVNITCTDSAPIYIKSADKVFITLKEGSENTLTDGEEYVQTDDNTVDGVIFSKADLTLNGSGSLTINGNYKHGILSKDDLVITGGTYHITAVKDGLNGKDCVKIKDGIFTISVDEGSGIQSKNDEDATKGYVYVAGGTITIEKCEEGIEGTVIIIEDGIIEITASDDGLNAASGTSTTSEENFERVAPSNRERPSGMEMPQNGELPSDMEMPQSGELPSDMEMPQSGELPSDMEMPQSGEIPSDMNGGQGFGAFDNDANCYIAILGGEITIDASGDGIDSNGSLYITGGRTYVSGPVSSGDGGLDFGGSGEISGGILVVASSAGMTQSLSSTSTQYSLMYNFTEISKAGTEVTLTDSEGNIIISYTPIKDYQSVIISTPNLQKESTYTLTSGSQISEITLSDIVTSNGTSGMGFPRGQGKK